jgi:hypothetical protein
VHYAHFSQLVNGSRWTFSLIFSSSNLAVCRDVTIQPLTSTKQARISLDNTLLRLLCCLASSSQRLCFVSSSPVSTRQGHRPLSPCVLYCDRIQTLDNRGCCAVDRCCVPSLVIVLPCVVLFSSILYNSPTRRCVIHRHKSAIYTHPPTLDVRLGAARKYLYIKQKETSKKFLSPLLSCELAVYLHHHG